MEDVRVNGIPLPMVGLGVFQIKDFETCREVVKDAIQNGYRLIDTAASYGNEEAVGEAIQECIQEGIVKREDLIIASKLWVQDMNYEDAQKAFATSLEKLKLEYLDIYLLHHAMNDYYGAWRALEKLWEKGSVKIIGVSNFFPDRLMDLCMHSKIKPMINQVELHPFFQQNDAVKLMHKMGVQPQAWGPLGEGSHGIFTHPLLMEIAQKHQKSVAQVVLRWNVQRGVIVIPRSINPKHRQENLDIWDFELTEDDMESIKRLDLEKSEIIDHFNPAIVKMIANYKIHD